ncbi:30S ribosomal protein S2 [Candidatus Kaiserbacteria bacterium RIFCSPLOWO2_02_FULL_54_13]|uniref:Small ribosomal subunit protein uS2 n=1 Tax=Candidatus Kaiserbacteria bacterium RIFCSPHIGHO2_02_FULL_54_22 TaxID=1798495 RepID=A0A1F6DN11_9BACT|nr:MAG: 30S ribosomal protein S2 [Parcubacteria group bacterium GW2011_GWA1_54_9]KKW41390.1 MAG: 30S ribosomal protein S2 [Parcubacteria group bacterium GW2011_GWB1_55_9]OGG62707.1 MAG: 30S ribosomal protein S2 [Candidatus Kaiserbacteria bacterium RIFCSPHIGHO2_02_FULL_54_22]OGG67881.1 MAG: 30S ribosomal protein S2 [Candidatus Kaiserbacteria bacterium RIFCSPHIGHO2_12_FULL_54_16]OGG83007.1 MAG: 30S ribosomal protein S2 [Candidatus Kaiserbacteria bacterium RIFCSPLOWO2_02_FULL_54_13]OGG90189.1 MAG
MADGKGTAEIQRLFDTGAHFAQVKSRRHPSMKPYLVGTKGRQEIIDLMKTTEQLEAAKAAMEALAKEGKIVLFVGGKVEIAALVKKAAQDMGAPYVAARWLGGTISNWSEIKRRIDRLAELSEEGVAGTLAKQHTKLELVKIEREKKRLLERLDGITTLAKKPDALLVIDTKHEKHAVKEANDAGILVIAIMSSDCNLSDAAYPIVANDTSRKTVELILAELTEAFMKGQVA